MGLLTLTAKVKTFLRNSWDKVIGLKIRRAPTPASFEDAILSRDPSMPRDSTLQLSSLIWESQQAAEAINASDPGETIDMDLIPINPILLEQLPEGDRFIYYQDLVLGQGQYSNTNTYLQQLSSPYDMTKGEIGEEMEEIGKLIRDAYEQIGREEDVDQYLFDRFNVLLAQRAF